MLHINCSRWGGGGFRVDYEEDILVFGEDTIRDYLDDNVVKDLLRVANMLSEMEIPGHLSLILILIIIFSRDGNSMEGQVGDHKLF